MLGTGLNDYACKKILNTENANPNNNYTDFIVSTT